MKKIILIIALLSVLILLNGQTTEHNKKLNNGLGFAAGVNSGSGFAFKHKFEKSAYQISFGALFNNSDYDCYFPKDYIYEGDVSSVDTTQVWENQCTGPQGSGNIGFQYFYYLHQTVKSAFYLSIGSAAYVSVEKSLNQKYKYAYIDSTHYETVQVGEKYYRTEKNIRINSGFGIGMEYKFTKNIVTSIGLPISFSFSNDNRFNLFMLIPQISLLYYF